MSRAAVLFILSWLVLAHLQYLSAQQISTVGNVLDSGGRKMTGVEVEKLYTGATVSGAQIGRPDVTFKNQYLAGGSVKGDSWRNGAYNGVVAGTWHLNGQGQICNDLANGLIRTCAYMFSAAGKYYSALADDRNTQVYERQFTH